MVLGRSRECDIVVDDANVSRRHAELRAEGDGWSIARPGLDQRREGQPPPGRPGRACATATVMTLGVTDLDFELE